MSNIIVYITCLTAEYHKQLPTELLNLGYSVSGAWSDNPNRFFFSKGIVTTLTYRLGSKVAMDAAVVAVDVKKAFSNIKGYYYSLVVLNQSTALSVFSLGNIEGDTDITRVLQIKALW